MIGEIFAFLAAITWSGALVLFKKSGEDMPPASLNLFKNLIGLTLLILTLPFEGELLRPFSLVSYQDIGLLCLSGCLGISLADTLFFASLNRVGVTRLSIIDCLYSPSVLFFSWLILGEELTFVNGIGALLIGIGILLSAETKNNTNSSVPVSWLGIGFGIASILLMSFNVVMIKPILQKLPLLWSTSIRLISGSIGLITWMFFTQKTNLQKVFKPHSSWRFSIPGAILGTYLSMIFWLGGFKYAKASVAGLLNQSSIVFAILLSGIFLKETFTRRKYLAIGFATLGVLIVGLHAFTHAENIKKDKESSAFYETAYS